MNTQIILIIVVAFIAGIIVRSIFKKKPGIKNTTVKTENVTVKTEDVRGEAENATVKTQKKNFLYSEIWDFVRGKFSEEKDSEIIEAAKTDKDLAIRIVKMIGVWNDFNRKFNQLVRRGNGNIIPPFFIKK